ncbi:MAG: hypothetical protein BGO78_14365 [Chloroflexi bacterium 44-23]|nr:MAG: hypothetical protein BGO78_14365 [Chloroflexi bacterium 44-23]
MDKKEELLNEIQKNNRVCPNPQLWNQLYEMLPDKNRVGYGREPGLPLILAAWWVTSNLEKLLRFREHINWAANHNCLEEIYDFIISLPEEDWHHFSD